MTIRLDRDLVFIDTETLGLQPDAPVWEVAAIRIDHTTGQQTTSLSMQIEHDRRRDDGTDWADDLPDRFRRDYIARYWADFGIQPEHAVNEIARITAGAIIAGSNPWFDMERLGKLLRSNGIEPTWHYHPLDIPSMALGNFAFRVQMDPAFSGPVQAQAPWKSDQLSQRIGVDPAQFDRHTALGDAQWCLAQWLEITQEKAW